MKISKAMPLILLALALTLTACTGAAEGASLETPTTPDAAPEPIPETETPEPTPEPSPEPTPEPSPEPTPEPSPVVGASPLSGEDFKLSGVAVRRNIAEVLDAFGGGYEYSEAISCDHDGMDKVYVYGGIEFYTYPDGENDLVNEIIVTSGAYKTPRGVGVGDGTDAVVAAYGDNFSSEGAAIVYSGDAAELWFYISDGAVEYISLAKRGGT
ncbi:MAG: hypothetical protein LBK23_04405 [Oscillospiraceae bacterium]|jgi:hypothetical protein|nr:hypothetical protein [Oscillospiraceae bacterium]